MARRQEWAERKMARLMLEEFPDEAVQIVESSSEDEAVALLRAEPPEIVVSMLRRMTPERAARVLHALDPPEAARALNALNPSTSAALLTRLEPEERERCMSGLEPKFAKELADLMAYPPDTAGAQMDPRVLAFRQDVKVKDLVRRLRQLRGRQIRELFVIDAEGRYLGSVPIQDVVLAESSLPLDSLLPAEPVSVQAVSSLDEVVETFERYGVSSLAVVDFEGRLLGVLRQRELIHLAQEQATASAVTMVGASEQERALSSPLFAIRKRLPWLQVNLLTAFLAAAVVGIFEDTIARVTALAVLLPVVAGQSGNTGAQALAVTMRGLALREVRSRHWLRLVTKETLAGLGNGLAVAATTAVAVYVWSQSPGLATVIATSMVASMAIAGTAGAAIPLILTALRQDPAQSSSIVLTTVTDVAGFFSFLGIATMMLRFL